MRRSVVVTMLVLLAVSAVQADTIEGDTLKPTDTTITADTTIAADTAAITPLSARVDTTAKRDTVQFLPGSLEPGRATVTDTTNLERHLTQNPTLALFKSMLVPGLGQIGNHKYVKAGVFIALETWFVGEAVHYGSQASDYRALYASATGVYERDQYYQLYQDRRGARNKYTWFAGITIFVSMFDAYVDAHLSGAPDQPQKEPRLNIDVRPDAKGGANLSMSLRF